MQKIFSTFNAFRMITLFLGLNSMVNFLNGLYLYILFICALLFVFINIFYCIHVLYIVW